VRAFLTVLGLSLIASSGFAVALPLGLLVAGTSCLVLEYLMGNDHDEGGMA